MKGKPLKIVIATDSFKGVMSARQACAVIRDALLSVRPDLDVSIKPMADGGEGTASALIAARNGIWMRAVVMGPLPDRTVEAGYAWFEKDRMALVEMASASGLPLLKLSEYNPLKTTTYGTGELIARSLARIPERILLAVGGSATVDGGVGAAMALGWRFLDKQGAPIGLGGEHLEAIRDIEPPEGVSFSEVEVLCDVDNPLCGEHGAAQVFGPQKGATPEMVRRLDDGLKHMAQIVRDRLGVEIENVPGAGAAGGLAAGAMAFMNARLVAGIETVISASGLERVIEGADWVITGEGRFDSQSLRGKVVSGIVQSTRPAGAKVAVMAGSVQVSEQEMRDSGVEIALPTGKPDMPMEEVLKRGRQDLYETARLFAREYLGE